MHALLLAAGILASPVQFTSLDDSLPIPAMLYEPAVLPAPAVVVLHACAGVDQEVTDWAKWLAVNGYIALVPDSLAPRRAGSVCATNGVTPQTRALDAYGALSYLRTRPDVDVAHVGEIGFSQGGGAILYTEARLAAHPAFAAAVAVDPSACGDHPASKLAFPLLLSIRSDDPTDAKTCVEYISSIDPQGALHEFDDPQTAEDAHARVLRFFARYLRGATDSGASPLSTP